MVGVFDQIVFPSFRRSDLRVWKYCLWCAAGQIRHSARWAARSPETCHYLLSCKLALCEHVLAACYDQWKKHVFVRALFVYFSEYGTSHFLFCCDVCVFHSWLEGWLHTQLIRMWSKRCNWWFRKLVSEHYKSLEFVLDCLVSGGFNMFSNGFAAFVTFFKMLKISPQGSWVVLAGPNQGDSTARAYLDTWMSFSSISKKIGVCSMWTCHKLSWLVVSLLLVVCSCWLLLLSRSETVFALRIVSALRLQDILASRPGWPC